MGIGLIVACREAAAEDVLAALASAGEPGAARIGRVIPGSPHVEYART